jgi:hypothetical protein
MRLWSFVIGFGGYWAAQHFLGIGNTGRAVGK